MRKKAIGVALIVAFAFTGIATASASAIEWKVEGAPLGVGVKESIKENITVVKPFILKRANGVTIECKMKVKVAFIEGPNKNGAEALEFFECSVTSNT